MICLQCSGESFREIPDGKIEQIYKRKKFIVTTPAMKCIICGYITVGNHQVDELIKRTKNYYKQYVEN